MFWFGAGLTLVTGIACGLYPAWTATRDRVPRKRRWQQALIVAQVGIATTLLLSGGLLLRSFLRLLEAPLGFNPRNVLTMEICLPPLRYPTRESRDRFFEQVLERTRQIPGVEVGFRILAAAVRLWRERQHVRDCGPAEAARELVRQRELRLLRLLEDDGNSPAARPLLQRLRQLPSRAVAVIDETLAKRYFAGENPIGQHLKMPWATYQIVGVVGSVKMTRPGCRSVHQPSTSVLPPGRWSFAATFPWAF